MNLSKLLNRKSITVIGLNSGTSVDGLDLAAIRVNKRFASPAYKYLIGLEKKFPSPLRQMTLSVADSPRATINEMMSLDSQLGQFFGRSAASFMKKLSRAGIKVDLISSHGQTIRHLPLPAPAWTVQAGSLDRIAALTGKIVIGDFRQADIALGGEGAPITTGAVSALLSHSTESRLIVNIGGISNFFYLPSSRNPAKIAAGDCGPGNSLCDLLAQRLFSQKFDRGGRIARAGEISKRLLTLLMGHPWFRQANKSTGRESFGPSMADRLIRRGKSLGLSDRDLMTTAAELTACSIALSVWKYLRSDEKMINLYLTGGGRKNIYFVNRLRHYLPDMEVRLVDELGIDGDRLEAVSYAVMAEACLRSAPLMRCTRKRATQSDLPVCGHVVQPPGKR